MTTDPRPDLNTFGRVDELGLLGASGSGLSPIMRLEPDHAAWALAVPRARVRPAVPTLEPHGTAAGRVAHEPVGWRPTTFDVRIRRYRRTDGGHVGLMVKSNPAHAKR